MSPSSEPGNRRKRGDFKKKSPDVKKLGNFYDVTLVSPFQGDTKAQPGVNVSSLAPFVRLFVREPSQDHLRGVDVSALRPLHVPIGLQDDLKALEVTAEAKFL